MDKNMNSVKTIKDATYGITGIQTFDFAPQDVRVTEITEQKVAVNGFNKTATGIKKVRGERTKNK